MKQLVDRWNVVAGQLSRRPALVAIVTWGLLTTVGAVGVHVLQVNPLTSRGGTLPLALGGAGVLVAAILLMRKGSDLAAAVVAGGYAAWVAIVLFVAYSGTPFGDSGLRGDTSRLTAMITRYTVTWQPVDGLVPSVPTEYPPLFPWLIARFSLLVHRPGWALLGDAEALAISLGVLGSFLLWRRLVTSSVALLLCILPVYVFAQPRKSYEMFVLALYVPWALGTFSRFGRKGQLPWLPAGIVLGIFLQVYQGYLVFSALGVAAIAFAGYRAAEPRRAYVRHLAKTLGTAFVVSAWYVVPYLYAVVFIGGKRVNDFYVAGEITGDPLGIAMFTGGEFGLAKVFGLVALIVLRDRHWWAKPMLMLIAGTYTYRLAYFGIFVLSGHTGYFDYTSRLLGTLLLSSAVLAASTLVPAAVRRWDATRARAVFTAVAVLVVGLVMVGDWGVWIPHPVGAADVAPHPIDNTPNLATYAHVEPLPSGARPRFHPKTLTMESLPYTEIADRVAAVYGAHAQPLTVSYTEKLFAYEPWTAYSYVDRNAANTFTHWDERAAALATLAKVTDPAAFADASQHTKFGGIDVFLLRIGPSTWNWGTVGFSPAAFDPALFEVTKLSSRVVLVIRRQA